jgi:hypothetical protein
MLQIELYIIESFIYSENYISLKLYITNKIFISLLGYPHQHLN